MTQMEAEQLVEAKLRDEKAGIASGPIATRYKDALKKYPATMAIALVLRAMTRRRRDTAQ